MKTNAFQPRERSTATWPTEPLARPGAWPGLRRVDFTTTRTGSRVSYFIAWDSWSDPLLQQDGQGRRLVEAFSALPLSPSPTWKTDVVPEERQLRSFLLDFGPIFMSPVDLERLYFGPSSGRPWDSLERIGAEVRSVLATAEEMDELAREDEGALVKRHAAVLSPSSIAARRAEAEAVGAVPPPETAEAWARHSLADFITFKLSGFRVRLVVDPDGRFGQSLLLPSLVEAIYWQLYEHLRRRPARPDDRPDPVFRIPPCGHCGGVILSTRLTEDRVNRWHSGCKRAGQARSRRARRRSS